MTFEAFLDGLNKGGFAFLGMVLVAAILVGAWRFSLWVAANLPKAWAELNSVIKESSQQQTTNLERALAQSDKVLERQSINQDRLMAELSGIADSHKTIVHGLNTVIDKIGGQQK